jgi:hypothetical protein
LYNYKKENGKASENLKNLKSWRCQMCTQELANANTKMFIKGGGASLST